MVKLWKTGITAFSGILALLVVAQPAAAKQTFELAQFIAAAACADCHSEIAEQWTNSMHHQAHRDPVYSRVAKFLRKGLTHEGEIAEAESCVKCHTPVGVVTGFPTKLSDDLSKTPEIAQDGIQCDFCHSAVDVSRMYNNGLVLAPGQGEDDPGVKYGPFDDAEPDFHEAEYSKLHTQAKFCGTCHDVRHVAFDTPLETTYTEWKNSPYNSEDPSKAVSCQGCHMYQRPGIPATGSTPRPENPGAATDYSEERPHIFTHYFVGANSGVPAMFEDETKPAMARERLQNAADISVKAGQGGLIVTVANTGAGHSIPTGLADLRQVWLETVVLDAGGDILFGNGVMNKDHTLPKDAPVFGTVFGDGKGNPVVNIAKAREVLKDNRIKAGQKAEQKIDLPKDLPKGAKVRVRLLYRSVSQKVLNLIPGEKIPPFPVVEMVRAEIRL